MSDPNNSPEGQPGIVSLDGNFVNVGRMHQYLGEVQIDETWSHEGIQYTATHDPRLPQQYLLHRIPYRPGELAKLFQILVWDNDQNAEICVRQWIRQGGATADIKLPKRNVELENAMGINTTLPAEEDIVQLQQLLPQLWDRLIEKHKET